jgi:hypothetical protein
VRPPQTRIVPAALLLLAACSHAPAPPAAPKSWIERSNENAQLLAETREGFAKGLLPPSKLEVENDLSTSRFLVDGVEKLFQKYAIAGSAEPLAELRR